jgi:hypothetical protein
MSSYNRPYGMNHRRAATARVGLLAFARAVGLDEKNDGLETIIGDLLCNLMHFCREKNLDFHALLEHAEGHQNAECNAVCKICHKLFDAEADETEKIDICLRCERKGKS